MKPLKALLVEDSNDDAALLLRHLFNEGFEVQSEIVQTAADMKAALAACKWDIILSDYVMPSFTGLDALAILKESGLDIPMIIISGIIGEDIAVKAMLDGANDYLMKGNLTRLAPAIEREIQNAKSRREQQQAEKTLRRSEASLANAQRIAHLGNFEWDIQNKQTFWSDEVYRILNLPKGAIEGSPELVYKYIHPDDKKIAISVTATALSKAAPYEMEIRIIRPNGEVRTVHLIGELKFDKTGEPLWLTASLQDITKSRRAEEKLRQSETNLAAAQRITHLGSWEVHLSDRRRINNNKVVWSDEVYRIFGYEPGQIEISINRYFDSIHPEDRKHSRRAFVEVFTEKKDLNIEFRICLPNGGERHLHGLAEVIYDEQTNKPQKIIGTVQDITARKIAEEALKQSEQDYRTVFEQAHDAIIIFAPEREIILDVNRRACEIYGFSRSEFIGMSIETISKIPVNGKVKINETLETGEYLNFETVQFRKDGSEMLLEINASTIIYQGQQAIISINRDISERKHAEEALRKVETRYRNLVELSPAIVYLAQPYPPYSPIYVSPNVKMFGYESEEWMSRDDMWLSIIHKEDRARVLHLTENSMSQGIDSELEYRIVGRNGEIFWVHDKGSFISDEQGKKIGWQGVILDITKTQTLEEQLRQSQKLESIGMLAGGIAHDFNNMLTAINGYSELTLRRLKKDDPLRQNLEEIKKAGKRSADLTQQLLAFSRQQVLQPVVLDLNKVIRDTIEMLHRVIDENIQITTILNPKVGRVKVDPGQFSQIVLNLAVNARDAMPRGGKLIIETVNIFLDPDYAERRAGVLPGAYVMLAVSDTGTGISPENKEHIFEPFFTTKNVGQGTGLGLATVYGIVKQSGGIIEVESEQGSGTTFKIYLPRVSEEISRIDVKDIPVEMPRGTETILLVEDEEMVRNLSRTILEECGYSVIEAGNGIEALEVYNKGDCKFNLLMTDVVMPKMGGRELADLLKEKLPDLKILFTSGYTDDAVVRHGVIERDTNFIQKPFAPDSLAKKIRELLDSSG